jgi:hypothetical protein
MSPPTHALDPMHGYRRKVSLHGSCDFMYASTAVVGRDPCARFWSGSVRAPRKALDRPLHDPHFIAMQARDCQKCMIPQRIGTAQWLHRVGIMSGDRATTRICNPSGICLTLAAVHARLLELG